MIVEERHIKHLKQLEPVDFFCKCPGWLREKPRTVEEYVRTHLLAMEEILSAGGALGAYGGYANNEFYAAIKVHRQNHAFKRKTIGERCGNMEAALRTAADVGDITMAERNERIDALYQDADRERKAAHEEYLTDALPVYVRALEWILSNVKEDGDQ